MFKLDLSTRVDGSGYFYGWAQLDSKSCRVDVLPPKPYLGDLMPPPCTPDDTQHIIFLEGDEVARCDRRDEVHYVVKSHMEKMS